MRSPLQRKNGNQCHIATRPSAHSNLNRETDTVEKDATNLLDPGGQNLMVFSTRIEWVFWRASLMRKSIADRGIEGLTQDQKSPVIPASGDSPL
jgi:hypothetical protein